jgi:hypothetical protein
LFFDKDTEKMKKQLISKFPIGSDIYKAKIFLLKNGFQISWLTDSEFFQTDEQNKKGIFTRTSIFYRPQLKKEDSSTQ